MKTNARNKPTPTRQRHPRQPGRCFCRPDTSADFSGEVMKTEKEERHHTSPSISCTVLIKCANQRNEVLLYVSGLFDSIES
jgi:hypothetical protein